VRDCSLAACGRCRGWPVRGRAHDVADHRRIPLRHPAEGEEGCPDPRRSNSTSSRSMLRSTRHSMASSRADRRGGRRPRPESSLRRRPSSRWRARAGDPVRSSGCGSSGPVRHVEAAFHARLSSLRRRRGRSRRRTSSGRARSGRPANVRGRSVPGCRARGFRCGRKASPSGGRCWRGRSWSPLHRRRLRQRGGDRARADLAGELVDDVLDLGRRERAVAGEEAGQHQAVADRVDAAGMPPVATKTSWTADSSNSGFPSIRRAAAGARCSRASPLRRAARGDTRR